MSYCENAGIPYRYAVRTTWNCLLCERQDLNGDPFPDGSNGLASGVIGLANCCMCFTPCCPCGYILYLIGAITVAPYRICTTPEKQNMKSN